MTSTQTGIKAPYESAKITFLTNNASSKSKNCVNISEENMNNVILKYQQDPSVAYAHSISSDFNSYGFMTAGVAVAFGRHFGKPTSKNCINSHLAYQQNNGGAAVYSLITKPMYYSKPTKTDYDIAFTQFAEDFKARGFKTLFCSPIGCVRDKVSLQDFIKNLLKFQSHTGARITVVSYDQKSTRTIRSGMTYEDFTNEMKSLVQEEHLDQNVSSQVNKDMHQTSNPTFPCWQGWSTPQTQEAKGKLRQHLNLFPVETMSEETTPLRLVSCESANYHGHYGESENRSYSESVLN